VLFAVSFNSGRGDLLQRDPDEKSTTISSAWRNDRNAANPTVRASTRREEARGDLVTSQASVELRDHRLAGRGILMALLATVAYATVDTLSKYQAREYPVGMIVWARYFVPLVLLLAVFLPRRGSRMLRTVYPAIQLARGVLLTAGTMFIVFAYRVMPIAEAQAISFIHPVLLTAAGGVFLGVRRSRLSAGRRS
jgi:hypothetical protein